MTLAEVLAFVKVAYGYKGVPYKVLVPICIVDTELDSLRSPEGLPPEEHKEIDRLIVRYAKFTWVDVAGKMRFYVYDEDELTQLEKLLKEDGIAYSLRKVTLTPDQEATISTCEKGIPITGYPSLGEVKKRLGLV